MLQQLKQTVLAMHLYHEQKGVFPAGVSDTIVPAVALGDLGDVPAALLGTGKRQSGSRTSTAACAYSPAMYRTKIPDVLLPVRHADREPHR